MGSSDEVEIKFRVENIDTLSARLRALGFEQASPRTHEMNTLFDLPGHPLRKRGDLLRLRQYGSSWVLTHKAKSTTSPGAHKVRVETETRVENGENMETILRRLQFSPTFRYEKFRSEWKSGEGHVVIDETPIGNFGEIEGPPEWIDAVAQELGITKSDYITETYAGLFFDWKRRSKSSAENMTFAEIGPGTD